MPLVDVIITCYNKKSTISRAIQAVRNQTLQDFLCIVVDDGSTDNSEQVILDAIKEDERFVYLQLENCGVANARNRGISLGSASFVTCLDGDDGMYPEFLETCYNAIRDDRSLGIVYTNVLLSHPNGHFTAARWPDCDTDKQFKGDNQIPCCNMFRRDVFGRLGGYRQRYAPNGAGAEDAELWLRFFKAGYIAKKISKEPLFIYNTFGGATQGEKYKEINWTAWHTRQQPFASLKMPENKIAHPVLEYDQPEISVIIPVGPNHEHYLIDVLDSLEAQTFRNWECIVVIDQQYEYGKISPPQYLQNAYPYVKWILTDSKHGPLGAGNARNQGVLWSNRQSKYVTFLDCDDYLQPRFLELSLSALKHFNADWIYTDLYTQTIYNRKQYELKCNELDVQGLMHQVLKEKDDIIEFVYQYQCDEWNTDKLWRSGIAAVTGLYKKSDFELVNGFDEHNNREDWDFHMRLAKAGKCGLRLPLPLFTYRLHTGIRREYKNVARSSQESQQLKQQDVQRIHNNYDSEELKMACGKCNNKKIEIQSVSQSDLTTLEYLGKIKGGTIRGVTGKKYPVSRRNDKFYIEKVHPQDAQDFIAKRLFKAIQKPKSQPTLLTSVTPIKVQVKKLSRGERLKRLNELGLQAQAEARRRTALEFVEDNNDTMAIKLTPATKQIIPSNIIGLDGESNIWTNLEQDNWYQTPENYTIIQLKEIVNKNKPTTAQLREMHNNEAMGKARKGALSFLQGKLK